VFNFQNQHIAIVGGSSGIGLAVAKSALACGALVTIMGRNRSKLEQAAKEELQGKASFLSVDIADEASVNTAFKNVPTPSHVYVAAASFVGGSILETPMLQLRAALDARLWGAVHVVRTLAPRMKDTGGSFVFTGGVSSDRPSSGAWPTSISTAASEQLARCLALELAPLRFNAIAPGWTDTPMWDSILGSSKAETFASVAAKIPTQRIASADEAALAVLTLMANRSINAEVLHVDGGHRLV
jgi:NAD(P)-dependent dehydrogenase (short-subunit alcohol dehydrogenase family)